MIFTMSELLNHIFEQETLFRTQNRMRNNALLSKLSNASVLIVTSALVLTEAEREQLQKIMLACKLEADAYYVNDSPAVWLDFRQGEAIRKVILFGVKEQDFGLNITLPLHQPVDFDGRVWIKTLPVSGLMDNPKMKSALWQQALKPVFAP